MATQGDYVKRLPVRFWPNKKTCIYGYLSIEQQHIRDDDLPLDYDVSFQAAVLEEGQHPRFDIRMGPIGSRDTDPPWTEAESNKGSEE